MDGQTTYCSNIELGVA